MVKHLPTMWETHISSWVRKILWRRKWQPTPVLLPGKSHGWRSMVGFSPWGHKEWDMTEQLHIHFVNMVYHKIKAHLIMMYDLIICCWILFARILLKISASMFISDIVVFFCVCVCVCGISVWFGIRVMVAS